MCAFLQIFIMALLQGVTEFLPVSSSGHLVVAGELFGFSAEKVYSLGVFMHAGSFFAIVIFYFKLLLGFFRKDQLHLLLMICIASIPAGVAGVCLEYTGWADRLFSSPAVTGMAFLVTGAVLRLTGKKKLVPDQESAVTIKNISLRQALIIGFVQMLALVPGISRSGSTISCGIITGIERESAAAFSFLLALPAIGGAALLELYSMLKGNTPATEVFSVPLLLWGVCLSAAVSFAALALLMNFVKKGKLVWFAWYLNILGAAVLLLSVAGMFKK